MGTPAKAINPRANLTVAIDRNGIDRGWAAQGACVGYSTELWFPVARAGRNQFVADYTDARRICIGCPVRDDCLAYAIKAGEEHGMWGGRTPDERNRIKRGAA